jgi:hypothetical protein
MGKVVYVETSIISYLAARPSRDVITSGHQQATHEWWQSERIRFTLCASALVLKEASAGDHAAATARLQWLQGVKLLSITPEAEALSEALINQAALPAKAAADALHVAIATIHRTDFLLTWNCKHIANAEKRSLIDHVCRQRGFGPPTLCTPDELFGDRDYGD